MRSAAASNVLKGIQDVRVHLKVQRAWSLSDRKYVPKTRKYDPMERKNFTATQSKYGSIVKRPRTLARKIVKKPVPYGKPASQIEKTASEIPPSKPGGPNVEESAAKGTEAASAKHVEEKGAAPASVEPPAAGHYELSPMLSKMVESELQNIMMKVWKLDPLKPQDAAEKIVVDRFRSNAGEGLRNTLGLNITKRLLNVHNPLYVKMQFSGKPIRADLITFLKRYNITAFKRVGERGGTFAAKMHSFQDFDDLCSNKTVKCGKVHVTVTPCYQFMTCPPNLRTPYNCKEPSKSNDVANTKPLPTSVPEKINESTTKSTEQENTANQPNVTPKVTPTKPSQTANTKPNQDGKTAAKVTPSKVQSDPTTPANNPKPTPAKSEQKPVTKAADTKPTTDETQSAASKVTPTKPAVAKQTQDSGKKVQSQEKPSPAPNAASKTNANAAPKVPAKTNQVPAKTNQVPAKTNQQQTRPQTATPVKVATQQSSATKVTPAKASQDIQNTAKATPNVTTPKVTTQGQTPATKLVATKAQNSQNTATVTPKVIGTPFKLATPKNTKVATKVATSKAALAKGNKIKAFTKAKVTPKNKQSDFDELSDHDILALISEGIVLDECSGSDIE